MTKTTRRILYFSAFLFFAVAAPTVVLFTAGFSWNGRLESTGVLVISSRPTADIWLNGRRIGQTPERISRLSPGAYQLELRRAGANTWKHTVRIAANSALVIGPVSLAKSEWSRKTLSDGEPNAYWLATPDEAAVAMVTAAGSAWTLEKTWPGSRSSWSVVERPTKWWYQDRGPVAIVTGSSATAIFTNRSVEPWLIEPAAAVQWLSSSPFLAVAELPDGIWQLDLLTQTRARIDGATSFQVIDNDLWYTVAADNETAIYRRSNATGPGVLVETIAGSWRLQPAAVKRLVAQHDRTREIIASRSATDLTSFISLDRVDRLAWRRTTQPPVWQIGAAIMTRLAAGQHIIDRIPDQLRQAAWYVPNHILTLETDKAIEVRSLSSRQGREIITTLLIPDDYTPLALLPDGTGWVGWDATRRELAEWRWGF